MTITREQGYAIEGGPEPKPAEDSPERLRERREALGLSHAVVANLMGMGAHAASVIVCVEPGGSLARDSSGYSKDVRTRYAAVLSAEEERRAKLAAERDAHAVPRLDWLEPASQPAPEVVDVPQSDPLAYADSPVWDDGPLPTPTLTRWHAELVAAETPRKAPDDTAPERLRERREALGKDDAWIEHILSALDVGAGPDFGYGRERRIAAEGVSSYTEKSTVTMRAAYAAALSAAEAERAAKLDHLAYADSPVWDDGPLPTPTPERPAPRFKVGDWVRHGGGMPWQVTEVRDYRDCYAYHGALGAFIEGPEVTLSPAIDPALHETARKTVAWLRGGARGTGPADFTTLPGWSDWNSGSRWDAAEHWAAQLERLLVDAP